MDFYEIWLHYCLDTDKQKNEMCFIFSNYSSGQSRKNLRAEKVKTKIN